MADGLLQGIGVTYCLDSIKVTKMHQGRKRAESAYTLELAHDEHVEFVKFYFNDKGITDLMMKTSQGNMLMLEEDNSEGEDKHDTSRVQSKDINLSDNGEALVGFKGTTGLYIETLSVYKAKRLDSKVNMSPKKQKTTVVEAMQVHSNITS